MESNTALSLRLRSLLLTGPVDRTVTEVVEWFGAMQAQDLNSVLWSLGLRTGAPLDEIVAATEERHVVRTWPMRGTVHLIPSADAHWMLDLTGVRQLTGVARRWEYLGLDEKIANRSMELLAAALASAGGRLTRSACMAALSEGGIDVGGQRGYHLLWYASQRSLTAIAPNDGAEQTFVLLDDWVPSRFTPSSREEGLAIFAKRYFRSHGPATVKDFAGWTALGVRDARLGIAAAGLVAVDVDGVEMWADPETLDAAPGNPDAARETRGAAADRPGAGADKRGAAGDKRGAGADRRGAGARGDHRGRWALPGFDEYMLGYKDRSLMASADQLAKIIPGGNGVFQSTLVEDGKVVATWKRTVGKRAVTVTVLPHVPMDLVNFEEALGDYAAYLGLPLIVKNP
ncbi:winged helix DNA-binding domain-containing protein [Actinoplanes sp. NPDC023714]|uniref:winged helix DNA-binding domain-containing protein n=1 Tax=Actinoplanes sp. NPDC023714 TaxID=3154322 RepID=UPI00340D7AE6